MSHQEHTFDPLPARVPHIMRCCAQQRLSGGARAGCQAESARREVRRTTPASLLAAGRRARSGATLRLPARTARLPRPCAAGEEPSAGGAGPSGSPAAGEDGDDDAPWIQDVTSKYIASADDDRALAAERALQARRRLLRFLRLVIVASYLSAVSVLLYFTPSLRHVFQATPRQVVLAALALYTIELGYRCDSGVRNGIAAFRRAEIESQVHAEMGGDEEDQERCELAANRTRRFLTALSVAAAVELCGAVAAAVAHVPVSGVLLVVVAQLPLRMCDYLPDVDGVVISIPKQGRTQQLVADTLLVACAAVVSLAHPGPPAFLAAGAFTATALWHIAEVRRVHELSEASLLAEAVKGAAPTAVRLGQ